MYKDNQECIDAYLRGEMTADQRHLFESELKDNQELRKEYKLTKAIVKALADRQEKLDLMRQWSEEMENENDMGVKFDSDSYWRQRRGVACGAPSKREACYDIWDGAVSANEDGYERKYATCPAPQRECSHQYVRSGFGKRKWMFGIAAAACIAVVIFAVKSIFFVSSPADGNYTMPNFGTEVIYRAGNSDISSVDSLIADKQYALALSSVDSLIDVTNEYLNSYGEKDSLTERDRYKVELNKESLYELEWRQIHLLIALNKKDEAKMLLVNYVDKNGMYQLEAKTILEKLNKKEK